MTVKQKTMASNILQATPSWLISALLALLLWEAKSLSADVEAMKKTQTEMQVTLAKNSAEFRTDIKATKAIIADINQRVREL